MKLGILTFHSVVNPGAFLQAFHLKIILEQQGHGVNLINYLSRPALRRLLKITFRHRSPRKIWDNIQRQRGFAAAVQREFMLTRRIHNSSDIDLFNFDAIVLGSDEIWNMKNTIYGNDSTYFGGGFNTPCIAYAPSAGESSFLLGKRGSELQKIKHLSARDKATRDAVVAVTKRDTMLVCDPTLLNDSTNTKILKRCPRILIYANDLSIEVVKRLNALRSTTGLCLRTMFYRHSLADSHAVLNDPLDFVTEIQSAQAVVTNTYHGLLVSIRENTPVWVQANPAKKTKLSDFCSQMNIPFDCPVPIEKWWVSKSVEIDQTKLMCKLQNHRKNSMEFLGKALDEI